MIEIVEIKENDEKKQVGISDNCNKVFVFRDRTGTLGVIQFSVMQPKVALLMKLDVKHANSLTEDLIVDGLIRTACHTFQREHIHWIVAENEIVYQNKLSAAFFAPLSAMREAIPDEILSKIIKYHNKCHVMKTDMIYKGCCKGD